ncbi:MAG: pyroglutamyl-peptidase I [Deltaproteobacteria bacterium]|nr:pyroglutamyl-peptidase I [Deltaproteobacteria bacterium]
MAAFEPFGGRRENQSERVVREVAAAPPRGVDVDVHILPVTFARLPGAMRALVAQPGQALVIVGEAAGARALRLERLAVNLIDARIADNAGARPVDQPVLRGAPLALLSTAPVKRLAAAARRKGAVVELSMSAGTFACNASYYLALSWSPVPVLFVHVPARLAAPRRHLMVVALGAVIGAFPERKD